MDGEGTITLCHINRIEKKNRGEHIRPIVQVVNTNLAMLEECQQIIGSITRRPKIKTKSFGNSVRFKHWKTSYQIQIVKHSDVKIICQTLIPYLVTKKLQAELVVKFVEIRESKPRKGRYGIKGGQNRSYSTEEFALWLACKQLNKESGNNTESVETIRQELLCDSSYDIVRSAAIQETAELRRNDVTSN